MKEDQIILVKRVAMILLYTSFLDILDQHFGLTDIRKFPNLEDYFPQRALLIWENLQEVLSCQMPQMLVVPISSSWKRPYFAKDTPNYGKAYHEALIYVIAQDFVIKELKFVKVRQQRD